MFSSLRFLLAWIAMLINLNWLICQSFIVELLSIVSVVPGSLQLSVKIKVLLMGKDVCVMEQHGISYDN